MGELVGEGSGQAVGRGVALQGEDRCRANMTHVRQSRPDSGLGFQVKIRKSQVVPSSLGSFWGGGANPSTSTEIGGDTPVGTPGRDTERGRVTYVPLESGE